MTRKLPLTKRISLSLGMFSLLLLLGNVLHAQLDVTFSVSDAVCHGLPNGSSTATPINGVPPYTYIWSNGHNTAHLANVTAGTYTLTVLDGSGQNVVRNTTIGEPSLVTVTLVPEDLCEEPFNLSAVGNGGIPPYNYNWSTGATTQTITVPSGNYCVTITDQNLCGAVECIPLTATPANVSVVANNVSCPGGNNGSLTATATAGQAPFTYQWSNGLSGQTISNLSAGVYTVTLTDANGCSDVAQGFVSQPNPIIINLIPSQPVCSLDFNGSISSNVTGGTPPYTLSWNIGLSTPVINNLGAGTYTLTVIDANGCVQSANTTLAPLSNFTLGGLGTPETCPDANDGFATANPQNGVMPYTYNWSTGHTEQVVQDAAPGIYTVTVTDAVGCVEVTNVNVPAAPDFVAIAVGNNPSTCGVNNGSVTAIATAGVGPFGYLWNTGQNTQTITNLGAGFYSVTITNPNGCTTTASTSIVAPPNVFVDATATNILCPGETSGFANASITGGTAPFSFQWSTGAVTNSINGLGAGTYTVTVTDANGCSDSDVVVIAQAPGVDFFINSTSTVCGVGNTGSATILTTSGTAPFSYLWSTGAVTPTVTGLAEGTHTVTVTDANGCSRVRSTIINVIDDLNVVVTGSNINCNGQNTGSATAFPSGGDAPYTYAWSTGSNAQTVSNLGVGTYTVVVTDANGCTTTGSYTVTQVAALNVSIQATSPVNCFGESDASLTAFASGGTPTYTYLWSNGATTASISGLGAGIYTVTVTDVNECTASASFTVTQAAELDVNVVGQTVVCGAENSGFAGTVVSGGTPPYNYLWSNGAVSESINNLGSNTYNVTVTDQLGCTGEASITINVVSDLSVNLIPRDALCFNENTGSVLAVPSGGSAPYTYTWSNNAGNINEITALEAGTYSVTVTEANGCTVTETVTIGQPNVLAATISSSNPLCNGQANGTANLTVFGGTAPYTYQWNNTSTNEDLAGLQAGNYIVTVTDANFCTTTASVNLIDPPAMNVNVTAPTITCAGSTGTATAFVTGGAGSYTYLWDNGQTTQTATNLTAGNYTLTVTDANGCQEIVSTIVVNELPAIEINFNVNHISCTSAPIGAITAVVSNGTIPYTYQWSTGAINTTTISGLAAGIYSLTVTDANSCQSVRSVEVLQTEGLLANIQSTNISCFGANDGSATAIANGGAAPYAYNWQGGQTTQTISGLAPGTYNVTIIDANECSAATSVTIFEPSQLVAGIASNDIDCANDNDGSATAIPSGGTPPYSFLWNNGSTNMTITNLTAGTHSYTLTDANGCTATNSVTISAPNALNVNITQNSATCTDANQGILVANVFGGTTPYTYVWSNGNVNQTASNLAPGTYSVTVTDANGCQNTATAAVTAFPAPTCNVSVLQTSTLGNNGVLQVNANNGAAPYTYLWSNGTTAQTASNLAPGTYTVTVTDANGCQTTCSATLELLAGIGNYVWEDIDHDGLQDPNEPVIPNVTVHLKDENGNIIDTTVTDANGEYYFLSLPAGTYSIQFVIPEGMDYTAADTGDDALDSDIVPGMNGMTGNYVLDPGELDFTVDGGLYVPPNAIISDPCTCLNNATTEINGQFSEIFTIYSYPNETWTILDGAGMYDLSSGAPPAEPVLVTFPGMMEEHDPGTYEFPFLLVHATEYMVVATNGFDTLTINNVCEYPTLNINELPDESLCLADAPIELGANPNIPGNLIFTINGMVATDIDPIALGPGTYDLVAHLVPIDPEECEANIETQFTVTEDCLAEVGNRVWLDLNCDGIQGGNEPGVAGVEVTITGTAEFLNPDVNMTTYTDANGNYSFMVPPGNYKLTFGSVAGYELSAQNQGGNDELDSDVSPVTMMTEFFHLDPYEQNLSFDMGLCPECINITYPGAIGDNQYLCAPGNDPEPFVSLAPASGGDGPIEYMWMYTNGLPNTPIQHWTPIPDSNSPTYDAGPLFHTTYFARCARTENCGPFLESNILIVEVGDETTANILGNSLVCYNQEATFTAVDVEAGSQITWNFPGGTPATATGSTASTTYGSIGYYEVELIVTYDGCTAYDYLNVTTSAAPTICGQGLVIQTDLMDTETGSYMIRWEMENHMTDLVYHVEHSADGENFERIATVDEAAYNINGINHYQYEGTTPKMGLNYYRVQVEDADNNTAYSNVEEIIMYTDSKIASLYPNPVENTLHVEIFETFGEQEVNLDIYSVSGIKMGTIAVQENQRNIVIPFETYPAGAYLVRLRLGQTNIRTMKVIRK